MKQTIRFYQFADAFRTMNREENFSPGALRALFDYLEQSEEESGDEVELDVIALCCDYAESDVETIAQDYRIDLSEVAELEDEDEKEERTMEIVMDYLHEHTMAIELDNGNVLYQNF